MAPRFASSWLSEVEGMNFVVQKRDGTFWGTALEDFARQYARRQGAFGFWRQSPKLPEGLRRGHRGRFYEFQCQNCGVWTEWPDGLDDFEPGHRYNVCGGSPRCLP